MPLLCIMWITNGQAQNVLHVRIDTLTVASAPNDVIIAVTYKLDAKHAHDFYGYDSRFSYDASKATAVSVIFDNSATDISGTFHQGSTLPGEVRATALGGSELDLSNPVLYRVRFTVFAGIIDTAFLHFFRFDITDSMKIDSVKLQDGWIRLDRPVVPPKKINLSLVSSNLTVKADSSIDIPIGITNMTGGELKKGIFSFRFDTTALDFVRSVSGTISGDVIVTSDTVKQNHVTVYFANTDTSKALQGAGTLLTLRFRAKPRTDTLCTVLTDTAFRALNTDALIDTVRLFIGNICVYGSPHVGVSATSDATETTSLRVWPNPATTKVELGVTGYKGRYRLQVFNMLGAQVFESQSSAPITWSPGANCPTGIYEARATIEKGNGSNQELLTTFQLIH